MPFLRRNWPVLLLVLLPLTVLWRCVFLGEVIGPWDQIMQMAPWNGPKPSSAWDVLQADGVLQFYPWRDLVFQAWGNGQLPFWNPYQLCGTPLLANSQSAGFYPPHILAGVLHLPTGIAITLLAWFHFAWAALGARALAKEFGAEEYGAATAGACFGLSAFMVSWTPLASVLTTCSWIPWVITYGCRALAKSSEQDKGSWLAPVAPLAGCLAMMFLSGHLQFAAYGVMGLIVVATTITISQKPKLKQTVSVALALVLGASLAAPQVLPAVAFSRQSHRQVTASAEGGQAYASSAIALPELTGFVTPALTGLPGSGVETEGAPQALPSYWPAYIKRGAAFSEGAIGIGPWILALVLLGTRKRMRETAALWVLVGTGTLLALGPLSLALYFGMPGWASTGSPGRAAVLVVLGLCVAAGALWPKQVQSKSIKLPLAVVTVLALVSICLALNLVTNTKPWMPNIQSAAPIAMAGIPFLSVVLSVLLGLGALVALKSNARVAFGFGLAGTLLSGSLFCLPSGRPVPIDLGVEAGSRSAFINSNWGLLAAARAVLPGNTATMLRVSDVAGYDSLLSKDTLEMLRTINKGIDPAPDANGNMMFVKPGFEPVQLSEAGVTHVWSLGRLTELSAEPEQHGNLFLYRLNGLGKAYITTRADSRPAQIVEESTDKIVVEVAGPGDLVVKTRRMEGWVASTGDPQSGLWLTAKVPEGSHKITFTYTPPGFQLGLGLAGASLLACALILWTSRRKPQPVV